jgi:histidinol-phosphatase (PHP family)
MAFVKCYYEHVSRLPEYYDFDIVGHFDLCYKHGQNAVFYDVESKEYKSYAIGAIEALAKKIPYFEVNTGCLSRGYKDVPYPLPFIVKEMKKHGFGAVISSDCHDANHLDCGFDEARRLLRDCGYNETFILTDSGFEPIKI